MEIAVLSGKGGAGKTTVAVSLAQALGCCTLVDLDVEEPNAAIALAPEIIKTEYVELFLPQLEEKKCVLCGKCSQACRYGAVLQTKEALRFFPGMCRGCGLCALVCPHQAIHEGKRAIGTIQQGRKGEILFYQGRLNPGERTGAPVVKKLVDGLPRHQMVIRDCPPGTSCTATAAVRGASRAIMVMEPTPFGRHDVSLVARLLNQLKIPFDLVINKGDGQDTATRELAAALGVRVLAAFPFQREIARGMVPGENRFFQVYQKELQSLADLLRREVS